jgi:ribosomal protein L29
VLSVKVQTSDQVITAIKQLKAERRAAVRAGQTEDAAVLDEEINDLRLALLKLRWKEQTGQEVMR